jgi:hypothetical protein
LVSSVTPINMYKSYCRSQHLPNKPDKDSWQLETVPPRTVLTSTCFWISDENSQIAFRRYTNGFLSNLPPKQGQSFPHDPLYIAIWKHIELIFCSVLAVPIRFES